LLRNIPCPARTSLPCPSSGLRRAVTAVWPGPQAHRPAKSPKQERSFRLSCERTAEFGARLYCGSPPSIVIQRQPASNQASSLRGTPQSTHHTHTHTRYAISCTTKTGHLWSCTQSNRRVSTTCTKYVQWLFLARVQCAVRFFWTFHRTSVAPRGWLPAISLPA
jgi:hypothetical protein